MKMADKNIIDKKSLSAGIAAISMAVGMFSLLAISLGISQMA